MTVYQVDPDRVYPKRKNKTKSHNEGQSVKQFKKTNPVNFKMMAQYKNVGQYISYLKIRAGPQYLNVLGKLKKDSIFIFKIINNSFIDQIYHKKIDKIK